MVVSAHLDWMDEALSAAQLVVGGVLGAFLGFGISREGVIEGNYPGLVFLLLWVAFFVSLSTTWSRTFVSVSRKSIRLTLLLWAILAGFMFMGYRSAESLGLDGGTLAAIEVAWLVLISVEVIGSLYHRRERSPRA